MSAASLAAVLRSVDVHAICDAIDAVADELRGHELDEEELVSVSEHLFLLAEHGKWEVRRAVAHALRHVRHGPVEATLQRLRDHDDASRVKKAAEESLARRTERKQLDLLPVLQDERLEKDLSELEKKHGTRARQAALRVGVSYAEFVVRGLYHEVGNAMTPVQTAAMILEHALSAPVNGHQKLTLFGHEKLTHPRGDAGRVALTP